MATAPLQRGLYRGAMSVRGGQVFMLQACVRVRVEGLGRLGCLGRKLEEIEGLHRLTKEPSRWSYACEAFRELEVHVSFTW